MDIDRYGSNKTVFFFFTNCRDVHSHDVVNCSALISGIGSTCFTLSS